jgi:hypothetical protein
MSTVSKTCSGAGETRRYNIAFAILAVATVAMWAAGEFAGGGSAAAIGLLVISLVKGRLVIDDFMGLRCVRLKWRLLVLGWLVLVLALIALAYWMGLR